MVPIYSYLITFDITVGLWSRVPSHTAPHPNSGLAPRSFNALRDMLSRGYYLRQNVQWVSRANKNTLSPKSTVRPYQIVRNQHVFVKHPAPRVTSRNVRSLELTQWNAQTRHFATISSTTPSRSGKVVGFFRVLFKVGVGSCAVALIAVGYVLWTT